MSEAGAQDGREVPDPGRIALLGGSGFIGSRLADRLEAAGRAFGILDIRESVTGRDTTLADVTDVDALRRELAGYDALVNLAAEHRDDVRPASRYHAVNVEGARNVCQVAREQGIATIVFTSTVAVYGLAQPGTDEGGAVAPANEYGRTKAEAERIYQAWLAEDPAHRNLVIVRPTVVFGEGNRGNVFNLLKQIHSGRFLMIGSGRNRKSMAYVENVAAFLEQAIISAGGAHLYNYVDKPDFDMNALVTEVQDILGRGRQRPWRIPFALGLLAARVFDVLAEASGRSFAVSSERVRKFCADTSFRASFDELGFVPPVALEQALTQTVRYEFLEEHDGPVFYTD